MAGNCRKFDSHERRSFINQSRQVIMSLLYDSQLVFAFLSLFEWTTANGIRCCTEVCYRQTVLLRVLNAAARIVSGTHKYVRRRGLAKHLHAHLLYVADWVWYKLASAPSLPVFRQRLKTVLFSRSYPNICVI